MFIAMNFCLFHSIMMSMNYIISIVDLLLKFESIIALSVDEPLMSGKEIS